MTYTGHKELKIHGQTLIERVKTNLFQEAAFYGVEMPSDSQIALVIRELRDHTTIMHATNYDYSKLGQSEEVDDLWPKESSIGRYFRDAPLETLEGTGL